MNGLLVKIHPSDLPEDEKRRRLWEVLFLLLRTSKKNQKNEIKRKPKEMKKTREEGPSGS
jgi:hypothetical protein